MSGGKEMFSHLAVSCGSPTGRQPEEVDGGEGPVDDDGQDEDHNQHDLDNIQAVSITFCHAHLMQNPMKNHQF